MCDKSIASSTGNCFVRLATADGMKSMKQHVRFEIRDCLRVFLWMLLSLTDSFAIRDVRPNRLLRQLAITSFELATADGIKSMKQQHVRFEIRGCLRVCLAVLVAD